MTDMQPYLKPCPCCKGKAELIEITDEDNENFGAKFIECSEGNCGITTQMVFNCMGGADERLIEMWNNRQDREIYSCHAALDILDKCYVCAGEGDELIFHMSKRDIDFIRETLQKLGENHE